MTAWTAPMQLRTTGHDCLKMAPFEVDTAKNALVAGAPPQTPLRELTVKTKTFLFYTNILISIVILVYYSLRHKKHLFLKFSRLYRSQITGKKEPKNGSI